MGKLLGQFTRTCTISAHFLPFTDLLLVSKRVRNASRNIFMTRVLYLPSSSLLTARIPGPFKYNQTKVSPVTGQSSVDQRQICQSRVDSTTDQPGTDPCLVAS